MAVKNLKIIFRIFCWPLTNLKFFVNCWSVSVLTEPNCFVLKLTKNFVAILSSNYWLHDFNNKKLKFLKQKFWLFLYYWLLLNSYHIIQKYTHYPNFTLIFLAWNRLSVDHRQSFKRKANGLNGFEIFFSFSTEFRFSHVFVVVFIVLRLILISYW